MNHIYKSIFNKALGVFTAVPEFASAHGKGSERTVVGRVAKGTAGFAASALAISVGLALTSTSVMAAPGIYVNDGTDPGCLALPDSPAPYTGIYGIGTSGSSISAGNTMVKPGYTIAPDSYFGLDQMKPCLSSGDGVHAAATQTNRTLFYGNTHTVDTSNNGAKNLTLGGRLDVNSGIIGVGDRGVNGAGATNSIRMGTGTTLDEANKKLNSISIGVDAGASATGSTAIGANAKARAEYSVALGDSAVSGDNTIGAVNGGGGAIAIGRQSIANNYNAIAIGMSASVSPAAGVTTASDGIAIGSETVVDNYKGIAVGAYSQAKGRQSTVIANNVQGSNYSTASGTRSQVYGAETNVSGNNSVAIGDTNTVASHRTYAIGNNINVATGADDSLAFGTRASVTGASTIAMGHASEALTNDSIAIGRESKSGKVDKFSGERSVAIGAKAEALGTGGIAIGDNAATTNGHNGVAIGVYSKTQNEKAISIGAFNKATGVQSIVIAGNYDLKNSDGVSVASGTRATVIGAETTVSGNNSVAIGDTNTVASARTYALGNNINVAAGADDSLVFGTRASVQGANTIAVGNTAQALTDDSITIGRDSKAGKVDKFDGKKSIAIGYSSEAMGSNAIALGSNAATNNGHDSIAMGTYAKTNGEKTISIGAYNTAEGAQSIVIAGNYDASTGSNRSTTTAAAKRAIVVGPESHATAEDAVAIGNKNTVASARTYAIGNNINVAVNTDDSLVFGTRAHTDFSRSIAMGVNASTLGQTGVAIGDNAVTNGVNQISIGHKAGDVTKTDNKKTRRPNVGNFGVMIGHYAGAEYTADEVTPVNHQHGTVAVGTQAGRAGKDSWSNIALGNQAGRAVHGNDNIAIGVNSGSGKMTDKVESDGKDVSTVDEYLNVKHSISVGTMSAGKNNYSIAIGTQATAGNGQKEADGSTKNGYSVAIGTSANASALNSVALGAAASASHEYSVALGRDSKTSDVHTGVYTLNTSYAAAGQPNAANGTVSVGSAGKERQIQNVAAGVISATSTDAINGSQLYATNNYLTNFAGDVATKLGGNAALDNDGHLTMTNIGGTGKDNVNDAIAAANTKVAEGENITVTPTTNADGSKTYTVATKKDLVVDSVKAGDSTLNTDGLTIANGPSITKSGINANGRKVTGVVDGDINATSTDAVNGSQLHATNTKLADVENTANTAVQEIESANPTALSVKKDGTKVTLTPNFIAGDLVDPTTGAVNTPAAGDEGKLVTAGTVAKALAETHFVVDTKATTDGELDGASQADQKIKSGNKVTLQAGKNLKAKQTNAADGAQVEFSLKDSISLTQVTAGDSTLNTDGLTIAGGPSVTKTGGINAGGKKITGVANGNVAAGSTDAVNGGQLAEVKSKADSAVQNVVSANPTALTATKAGDTVTLTPNFIAGDLVNADGTVNTPAAADEGKLVSAKTVADALKANHFVVDTQANGGAVDAASEEDAKVGSGNKVTFEAGKNLVAQQTNTANGGATVNYKLSDTLENLVSVKSAEIEAGIGPNKVVLNNNGVKVGDSTLNDKGLTINNGPSVTDTGIDAGNKKITGVADGNVAAGSTDAVNGGQLAAVKAKADSAVQDIKSGDEKALSVTKAGNTYTITPNLSGDLVDANGNITAPTTPADKGKLVTAGTVAEALANTHFVVDTKATDGELDAASQADQKIKAGNKVTLQAGKNLKAKQTNGTNGAQVEFSLKDSISLTQVTAGTGDNQVVLGNDGVQVGGNTYINKDGLNANNKVISNVADGVNPNDAVNKGQLDAVKGVADSAVKSVDVVANENNLVVDNTDPKNPKLRLRKAVDLDSIKLENNVGEKSFLNSAGLTIKDGPAVTRSGINANNTKVTNVTDGDVNGTSKDAVNGSQLYNVASNVKDLIGPDAAIDPATGKVTVADPTKGIGGTGKGNIGDAIQSVKDAADKAAAEHTTVKAGNNIVVTEGTNAAGGKEYTVSTAKDLNVDSVKAGDTTVNNDGLTIAGGPSVKKDGIDAGDKNITNVADGNVAAGSKDAVNGGQLYDVAKNVADLVGPDATIDPATGKVTVADPTKGIGETGKGTIGDAIKAVNDLAKKAAAEKTSVKAKDGRSNVTVTEGTNAAGGHEYTVDVERAVTEAGSDQVTVTSKHDADSNTTTYTVDVSDKTKASLAKADSAVQGLTSKDGNLNFNKDPNGNVEVSFNDNLNVKNITADGVKAGDTTINSNGIEIVNGPSMTKDGINAGSKAITNVANGNLAKGSTDAVNGGQLHDTAQSVADVIGGGATVKDGKVVAGQNGIGNTGQNTVHGAIAAINQNTANNFNQIRGDLRKMDRDLRGGIAGALATAGLPQAFRPGKSMVAAAASTYRGQSGLAIGVSRISDNGKVILKVTGNTNSRGDFGGTIGAGYQW